MSSIIITDVSKKFPGEIDFAIKNLSVDIPKGNIVAIAGPDGAGKTTLIRLIAALLIPTEGTITTLGFDTKTESKNVSLGISYMPQRFGLYEELTVMQNLDFYADLKGVYGEERDENIARLLEFTGLTPFKDRLAGALSGGMKQKLGLASTMVKVPSLLLLDEPSVGVDPISRRELFWMVQELCSNGISVIWSTSYLDEAEKCDQALLLDKGSLLFFGKPQDLSKRALNKTFFIKKIEGSHRHALQRVIESENVLDGTIASEDIRIVVKNEINPPIDLKSLKLGTETYLVDAKPRFEDGFIEILGGGPKGGSLLADKTRVIEKSDKVIVEADRLTKNFGTFTAASEISFKIKQGEIFGLLGPNGAGKSTTFKMLCGLMKPTSGEAFVNGIDLLRASSKARSRIGYMAQKFSLYGDLSLLQNLEFFASIYNLKGSEKKDAIDEMIEVFDFKHYLNENAMTLPLGFKQRLSLAVAIMHQPDVLFLDEPTSGVDPIARREFWHHINGVVGKGVTVLVTTHFMDEAEYCDRIALIYQSKIIKLGSPEYLKAEVATDKNKEPTLEDAFIDLIQNYDGVSSYVKP